MDSTAYLMLFIISILIGGLLVVGIKSFLSFKLFGIILGLAQLAAGTSLAFAGIEEFLGTGKNAFPILQNNYFALLGCCITVLAVLFIGFRVSKKNPAIKRNR